MGRKKKYQTAKRLKTAVDAYFTAITYQDEFETAGGEKKQTTVYLKPPSLAGLCLALGISRETWAQYGKDEALGPVVELARMRVEEYWTGKLAGKSANGARFALTANFGWDGVWKDKREVTQTNVGMSVEEYLVRLEQDGKKQEF